MKQLFKNLLLIVLVKGFISSAPCCYKHQEKPKNIAAINAVEIKETPIAAEPSDIHPMNILSLRFN